MAYKVFISHSNKDQELVEDLKELLLTSTNIKVFVAEQQPTPGRQLDEKVLKNIKNSNCVIALLTRNGINSRYVHHEIGASRNAKKILIPVVEKGIKEKDLGILEGKEWLELDPKRPQRALVEVFKYLKSLAGEKEEYRIKKMVLTLETNSKGDVHTRYRIKIVKKDPDARPEFCMPYHDYSNIPEKKDIRIQVTGKKNKKLQYEWFIFTDVYKRFYVALPPKLLTDKEYEFNVELDEKELFDVNFELDYYEIDIIYPIDTLKINIKLPKVWTADPLKIRYGDSLQEPREVTKFERLSSNEIICELENPIVGKTYFIFWEWKDWPELRKKYGKKAASV